MLWSVLGTDRRSCGLARADSQPRRSDLRRRRCSRRRPVAYRHGRARAGPSARSSARSATVREGADCEDTGGDDAESRSVSRRENDACDRETRAEQTCVYSAELHASELCTTADRVVAGLGDPVNTRREAGADANPRPRPRAEPKPKPKPTVSGTKMSASTPRNANQAIRAAATSTAAAVAASGTPTDSMVLGALALLTLGLSSVALLVVLDRSERRGAGA